MDEREARIGHLACGRDGARELLEDLDGLGDSRRPERVAAPEQPTAWVDHDLSAQIAPSFERERSPLSRPAESERFVLDDLGDREAVVDLGKIDVLDREPRLAERFAGGSRQSRPLRQRARVGEVVEVGVLTGARIQAGRSV